MTLREGTLGQRALFALLLGVYLGGLAVAVDDKLERVGAPDPGWVMDGHDLTPTRLDAARAGIRGGGRALELNGVDLSTYEGRAADLVRREAGAVNTVTLQRIDGQIHTVELATRPWTWEDAFFSDGVLMAIGLLLVLIGAVSFWALPYQHGSWAMLAMTSVFGALISNMFLPAESEDLVHTAYFRALVGLATVVPLHGALAFPKEHRWLRRSPAVLVAIYGVGLLMSVAEVAAWYNEWQGPYRYVGGVDSSLLALSILTFTGRCAYHAFRGGDSLIRQRARIVLGGLVFGAGPPVLTNFLRVAVPGFVLDRRVVMISLLVFVAALARVTVRHDLMNARVAVRGAVLYGAAVALLTLAAVLLVAVSPYLVALLLLPVLVLWPRFYDRLNAVLYPERARLPERLREIGDEMANAEDVDGVLGVLAEAPERLFGARGAVAFLFPDTIDEAERVRASGAAARNAPTDLHDETIVQLMATTRKEITRDQVALDRQYSNVREECLAELDALDADVLLPILRDGGVVGGLALGPRQAGDPYERPETGALQTLALTALQAIARIQATERLRERELEFSDLKRFFPPQIIDQVMERGGAAELRTQRKPVTVFFADLRGFTSFSDRVEPEEVMSTLAEYHEAMGKRIAEFAGTLERFAGDGFMVFFNDPVEQPDHVERAARMALAMLRDVAALRETWAARGYSIDVGMGIHTGYATCGFIGYEGRRDYGVIGNVTNLAARLSDAAGGGEILVSAQVRTALGSGFRTEAVGDLELKGFREPMSVFRLLG